jgi:hypothetical protein
VARFFIDTDTGQVASQRQLAETGVTPAGGVPPRPWYPVSGTGDASTMWYAVLRREMRGVFIGTLALRHSDHHASLLQDGWQEVPVQEIAAVTGETRTTNMFTDGS